MLDLRRRKFITLLAGALSVSLVKAARRKRGIPGQATMNGIKLLLEAEQKRRQRLLL
jgi:hypothetical protein